MTVALGDDYRKWNGSIAHVRCLEQKSIPKFREEMGKLLKELVDLEPDFEIFYRIIEEIRRIKEAERLALDLTKRLSFDSKQKRQRTTFKEALGKLKSLTETHLFWELPVWTSVRPHPRTKL